MTQQTAQGLASLGRGPDSMLVHMAPGEVKSLQQFAMAHGGSLTINPETGLPEAGFLSSLLPMIIGGGLTIASGGALSPLMAGMITGGGFGLATGSLKKGLMAGLGAYGGAGLGSALAGAGASAGAAGANAIGAGSASVAEQTAINAAKGINPEMFSNAGANFNNAITGTEGLLTPEGRTAFMGNAASKGVEATGIGGGKGLMQFGLAAAAPMLMDTTTKQPEFKQDASMGQRYQFNAGSQTPTPVPDVPGYGDQSRNFGKEQRYFTPSYTPIDNDAAKKLYGFASGGPVEAMSDANSIGMNTGYPQADVEVGAYATPYQQPISRNVVTGVQGAGINPYTGQAQFADGGEVGYTYDPTTQMYVKKSGEGATMVSPTGGISGASAGGDRVHEMSEKQANFFDTESKEDRDARVGQFADLIGMVAPGYGALNALSGLLGTSFAGSIANAFGGTQAPAPVSDAVGKSVNDINVTNPDDGRDGIGGEGIGGGDISGASADTPALARGGISNLGDYSDGGRLLRGPGDGISDSIPATIGKKRPARLADGEFVVPARIVSELGNGSTEAGARKLYAMMDRVQKARGKTVGKGKVAANSRAAKHLPA